MRHLRPRKRSTIDLRIHHRLAIGWPGWPGEPGWPAWLVSLAGQPGWPIWPGEPGWPAWLASLAGQPGWPTGLASLHMLCCTPHLKTIPLDIWRLPLKWHMAIWFCNMY